MNIVLIGFKNSGKSSVGKLIAQKTQKMFTDTDYLIQKRYYAQEGELLTARQIYQNKGRQYFRALEKAVILGLSVTEPSVVATGGGSVLDWDNVVHLKKQGTLVYLSTPLDILLIRLQLHATPAFLDMMQSEHSFRELYKNTEDIYRRAADLKIATDNKSIADIAEAVVYLTGEL